VAGDLGAVGEPRYAFSVAGADGLGPDAEVHVDALLGERGEDELANARVLARNEAIEALDERHARARAREERPSSMPTGPPPSTTMLSEISWTLVARRLVQYPASSRPSMGDRGVAAGRHDDPVGLEHAAPDVDASAAGDPPGPLVRYACASCDANPSAARSRCSTTGAGGGAGCGGAIAKRAVAVSRAVAVA
jgi:hypothetical protein